MRIKRILTFFIALCILLTSSAFAKDYYATRGEVTQYLLTAADYYNPGVEKGDILFGYEDGSLHED